jgi:hypothetical protein
MAFDVEAAKAEGYTDEEIAAYLRAEQGTPVPVQEQPSRAAEVTAAVAPTMASYIPEAVAAYGAYKYGTDIARAAGNIVKNVAGLRAPAPTVGMPGGTPIGAPVGGPVAPAPTPPAPTGAPATKIPINAPVQPTAPTTAAGRPLSAEAQQFLAQRNAQAAEAARMAQPRMAQPGVMQQVQKMAFDRLAPVANAARAIAPAAIGLGALTYSSGLNQGEDEELRRRRMMQPTITK